MLLRVVGRWLATVIGVAALLLILVDAAPGDAIDLLPDGESLRAELETRWGLGRPLPERLARWLTATARGDLGTSWVVRPGTPVSQLLAGPALDSLARLLAASVLSILASLAVAWRAAGRVSWLRSSLNAVSLTPVFLLAHLVITGLNALTWRAIETGWIDRPTWFALPTEASVLRALLAVALLAVGSAVLSGLIADLEDALVRLRKAPFVLAARARGEDARLMVARNLFPTAVALLSDRLAFFVGGLVILEKVFLLGGAGSMLWRASLERDIEVVLAIGLGAAVVVATGRLTADVLRAWLDPRLALTPSR